MIDRQLDRQKIDWGITGNPSASESSANSCNMEVAFL